jgi:hypothetical protein
MAVKYVVLCDQNINLNYLECQRKCLYHRGVKRKILKHQGVVAVVYFSVLKGHCGWLGKEIHNRILMGKPVLHHPLENQGGIEGNIKNGFEEVR